MAHKILLIDDERDFTELTGTLLGFHDFDVDMFNDPVQIDDILSKKKYDIVVTDLMMPGMDGFELIRRLRNRGDTKNTPIIVLSAKTLTDEERKFLIQNSTHFLVKPFDPQGLVDQVTQLIQ